MNRPFEHTKDNDLDRPAVDEEVLRSLGHDLMEEYDWGDENER